MDLSPEHFKNIRFHTGLINGSSWEFWHPYPRPNPDTVVARLGYLQAIEDVPEKYWAGEPPTPNIPRPLGVSYRGHIVNSNVVRYQQCISSLYHSGALDFVLNATEKKVIVEVGGGYGGLAHCIGKIVGERATYVLIDLPEMLLFQGAFLTVNNPTKSIYIYNKGIFDPSKFISNIREYDFILMPNFSLKELYPLNEIAFFINMQSFQEMTEPQVKEYLDFAQKRVSFCIYSDIMDRHPYNEHLSSVSGLLQMYFALYPSPQYYEKKYKGIDVLGYACYKKYIGFLEENKISSLNIPNFPYISSPSKMSRLVAKTPGPIKKWLTNCYSVEWLLA
jgi:hypothetical protein